MTSRVYLLALEASMSPDDMVKLLRAIPQVHSWHIALPSAALLISSNTAHELTDTLREQLPGARFFITEVRSGNNNGFLAAPAWDFVNYPEALESDPDMSRLMGDRISQALATIALSGVPSYSLAAMPLDPVTIPTLFASRDAEVVALLRNPPTLRPHGFGLETGQEPLNIVGQLRRASVPQWKNLELWADGFLAFVAEGEDDFLCWASRDRDKRRPLRINPLVLLESSLLFATLAVNLVQYMSPRPWRLHFILGLNNMRQNGRNSVLAPGPLGPYDWHVDEAKEAPSDHVAFPVTWRGAKLEPEEIAFSLVSAVYRWFGFNHDQIPYSVQRDDGGGRISAAQILAAGRSRQ